MLRKQPNNVLMPSAHAVDREYRVLTALQGSAVPTPKPYRYCADRDVIGTPFYLMEWLDGRVFHEFSTPGLRPDERRELFRSMCAALAAIHPRKFSVGGGERRLKEQRAAGSRRRLSRSEPRGPIVAKRQRSHCPSQRRARPTAAST